ncbi:LysM peptidoglycan-binding domain-containing protein [Zavarzinia sp.]|uniref:LysM peptidoglycan-binding domain-containing protein n=1 Tax=Zavarzinia sp. TaxID=2027920 RepID=UPI00356B522B
MVVAAGATVLALVLGLVWWLSATPTRPTSPADAPQAPAAPQPAPTSSPQAAAPAPQNPPPPAEPPQTRAPHAPATPPSFDLARIAQDGTAVLAGHAPAESVVKILGNGATIGTSKPQAADGSWVLVVDQPLPEGTLELSLEATLADGTVLRSEQVVLVEVPSRKKPGETPAPAAEAPAAGAPTEGPAAGAAMEGPVAVLTNRDGATPDAPSRVLQAPDQGPAAPSGPEPTLETVEYGADGAPLFSGRAAPDALVRLYLGDRLIAETKAGADGRWRATPKVPVEPGRYSLRIDVIGADGKVIARRELPFERAPVDVAAATPGQPDSFTVQPGNSLWRIARSRFGTGYRYIDIYRANKGQIRDPDLIYPGQVLGLPH